MLTLALLAGLWTTTCIQTQLAERSGFTIESYEISEAGDFIFNRQWFSDSKCSSAVTTDQELGTVKIGKEVSTFFGTTSHEADFKTLAGSDFGVVSVKENKLKLGRGFLNTQMRNTMLGLFDYIKR
jgi:hypothetical protein